MEQLALWEDIPKKSYYRLVVQRLKDYPHWKKSLDIENIQEDKNKIEIKKMRVQVIEAALSQLDHEEQKIIQISYFFKEKPKDISIMLQLGMSRSYYYQVKDEAIRKIATVMNII